MDAHGLSSLAMTNLEAPNLLLYLPTNQTFILHPLYSNTKAFSALGREQIEDFLIDAANGKFPVDLALALFYDFLILFFSILALWWSRLVDFHTTICL